MQDKICSYCKTKLSEFYKNPILGCSHCYEAFEEELFVYLRKVQGKTYHIGKTPEYYKNLQQEYQDYLNTRR